MINYRQSSANDNGIRDEERPIVAIPDDQPEHAYARRGNLILPLRFARRMPEWAFERIELTGGVNRG